MVVVVNSHRTIVIWIFLGFVPLFVGCGQKSSVDRIPVHGTVRLTSGETLTGFHQFLAGKRPRRHDGGGGRHLHVRSQQRPRGGPPKRDREAVSFQACVPSPLEKKAIARSQKAEWNQSTEVLDDGKYVLDFTLKD